MDAKDHLYCLTKFQHMPLAGLPMDAGERVYNAQLVFSGPDAAIEVSGHEIRGLIDGAPSHPGGQLAEMIENYRSSILDAAKALRERDTDTVVVAGRWHHVDVNEEPRFEAYLVHRVTNEGTVITTRYEAEIFDWDDLNGSGKFGVYLKGDPAEDGDRLRVAATNKVEKLTRSSLSDGELPAVDGVLWYPDQGQDLPLFFSSVKSVDFPGDGTISSSLRARASAIASELGVYRGTQVDRKTHRPPQLTLDEVLASTNTVGYWFQHDFGSDDFHSVFVPTDDARLMGSELLQRLDGTKGDDTLSCEYAGDWQLEKASKTKFRILAVGPTPGLSRLPL